MWLGEMLDHSMTEVEMHWFVARYGTDESVVEPGFLPSYYDFPKEIVFCLDPGYSQDVQNRLPSDVFTLIIETGRVVSGECFKWGLGTCPGY